MNVTDTAVIQELVVCSQKQLGKVAKKHDLSAARAQVMRDHWIRRITSRCVQCNILVRGDKCPQCKTPKQLATKFLQEVKPKEVILRRECSCGRPFYYSAGYILKMFESRGEFKPSSKCPQCRARPKVKPIAKTEKTMTTKTPKAISTKKNGVAVKKANVRIKKAAKTSSGSKKVKTARVTNPKTRKTKKSGDALTFRPFVVLEGLKVKN